VNRFCRRNRRFLQHRVAWDSEVKDLLPPAANFFPPSSFFFSFPSLPLLRRRARTAEFLDQKCAPRTFRDRPLTIFTTAVLESATHYLFCSISFSPFFPPFFPSPFFLFTLTALRFALKAVAMYRAVCPQRATKTMRLKLLCQPKEILHVQPPSLFPPSPLNQQRSHT